MDSAQGEATTEATWDDTDVARLETIPDVQLHRNVDAPILAADKEGEPLYPPSPAHLYLHMITRIRESVLGLPCDDLWRTFWKAGGSGCSKNTFHSNPYGDCQQHREKACRPCRSGIERLASRRGQRECVL